MCAKLIAFNKIGWTIMRPLIKSLQVIHFSLATCTDMPLRHSREETLERLERIDSRETI